MTEQPTPPTPPAPPPPTPPPPPRKRSARKVLIIVLIAFIGLLVIMGIGGGLYAWRFTSGARNIEVEEVNIAAIPDGDYEGGYKFWHVDVEVEVIVEDGEIETIGLLNDPSNEENVEEVLDRVVDEQSLEVDLVSGASVSQKVALKAVEEALTGTR